MSSSGELPDWTLFAEREEPIESEMLAPALEMAAVLQKHHADAERASGETDAIRRTGLEALAEQAVFVFQLESALARYEEDLAQASLARIHRHLRVLKDQMLAALKKAGLEIIVPLGKTFDEVADSVHVTGWRHLEEFTSEVVAEVTEPVIKHNGELVRAGQIVMGAPLEMAVTQPLDGQTEQATEQTD